METAWESNFPVVRDYQVEHGTTDGLTKVNPTAGRWLTRWRQADVYFADHGTLAGIDEVFPADAKAMSAMSRLTASEVRLRLQRLRRIPGALPEIFAGDDLVAGLVAWLEVDRDHTIIGIGPDTMIDVEERTIPLGSLLQEARRLYATGRLSERIIQTLESVPGWTWTPPDPEQVFFDELDWWISVHGDAQVPQLATSRLVAGKPYPLGRRVNTRRDAYFNGTLSQAQIHDLEQRPGWAWEAADPAWFAKLAKVASFVERTGSIAGLSSHDLATYRWLNRQLSSWDKLSPTRRDALTKIPGVAPRPALSPAELFLEAAAAWLEANPTLGMKDMPTKAVVTVNGQEVRVGKQASNYRTSYTNGRTPPQAAKMEQLRGWTWPPRKHPSPAGQ